MSDAPRFCQNCGQPLAAGVRFCSGCGSPLGSPPGAPPVQPGAAPPPAPVYAPPPPPHLAPPRSGGGCRSCLLLGIIGGVVLLIVGSGLVLLIPEKTLESIFDSLSGTPTSRSESSEEYGGVADSVFDDIHEDEAHEGALDAPLIESMPLSAEMPPPANQGPESALSGLIRYKCTTSGLLLTARFTGGEVDADCRMPNGEHPRNFKGPIAPSKTIPSEMEGRGSFVGMDGNGTATYSFSLDGEWAEIMWTLDGKSGQQWTKWNRMEVTARPPAEGK
ncbi:MAG: zinc ribbon domain-containing protein [Planctomycetes bacterium]|nr:zinc ribbon domain-containing protein [Planctomycetota bacterium]